MSQKLKLNVKYSINIRGYVHKMVRLQLKNNVHSKKLCMDLFVYLKYEVLHGQKQSFLSFCFVFQGIRRRFKSKYTKACLRRCMKNIVKLYPVVVRLKEIHF